MTQPQGANLKTIEWGGRERLVWFFSFTVSPDGRRAFEALTEKTEKLAPYRRHTRWFLAGFLRWICADRGPSSEITGRESGIPEHAQDLLALVGREGLEQVVLIGHLVGARVGVYLAAHHPARLRGLVLIYGGSDVTDALLDPSIERLRGFFPSREAYLEYLKNQPPFKNRGDEHLEHYFTGGV